MKPIVNLYKLGRLPYDKALKIQNNLSESLKQAIYPPDECLQQIGHLKQSATQQQPAASHNPSLSSIRNSGSLLLVEHEPVYTIGLRTKSYKGDYESKLRESLSQHDVKADFVRTNRGGLITYHGPGQLVAYPIIYMGHFSKVNKSIRSYVRLLENTIIDSLYKLGINNAHTIHEHPGIWLNSERKIAFVGINCNRYVTMHGISINCDCDLSWFDHIVSCGIEDKKITSVEMELPSSMSSTRGTLHTNNDNSVKNIDDSTDYMETKFANTYLNTLLESPVSPLYSKRESILPSDILGNPLLYSSTTNFSSLLVDKVTQVFTESFEHHFDCELR